MEATARISIVEGLLGGHDESAAFDPRELMERYHAEGAWGDSVRDLLGELQGLWEKDVPRAVLMLPEIVPGAVLLVTDGLERFLDPAPKPRVTVPMAPGFRGAAAPPGRYRLAVADALGVPACAGISWVPLRLFGAGALRRGETGIVRRFLRLARPSAVVAVGRVASIGLWRRAWPDGRTPDAVLPPPPADPRPALCRLRSARPRRAALDSAGAFP